MATCFDNNHTGNPDSKTMQHLYLPFGLNRICILILMIGIVQHGFAQDAAPTRTLRSPDNNLRVDFQHTGNSGNKKMYYRVFYKNKPVILESQLNIKLDNHLSQLALALKTDAGNWCDDMVL